MARSHTKKGPGRTHGQCQLIVDPGTGQHLGVTQPKRRFPIATKGGNWKGADYISQVEHDRCVRATFCKSTRQERDFAYRSELEVILASRGTA